MKNKLKFSRKREDKIAKDTGGKRHARSGGLWWKKGDASSVDFLFEDKFTEHPFFSLTTLILQKIEKEALAVGKLPVVRIGFIIDDVTYDYAILRSKDCIITPDDINKIPFETTLNKSIRLSLDRLYGLYVTGEKFILRFWISEQGYIIMTWKDFLSNKDKIIHGEVL